MKTLSKIFMVILACVLFCGIATAQATSGYTRAVDSIESYTVNVPNSQGGYTAILLKKSGDGYAGPQGKYFPRFPSVSQLQSVYELGTPNSTIQNNLTPFITEPVEQDISPSTACRDGGAIIFLWGNVGWGPQKNCLYRLGGLRILQKLNDGYLIEVSPLSTGEGGETNLAFLYTSKDFDYQQELFSLWGYYVGSYEYQTQTGFKNSVLAFRLSDRKL